MGFRELTDLIDPEPIEALSASLVGIFECLKVDERTVLESEVEKLGVPALNPARLDELLEGWDDISMELRYGWRTSPAYRVGNGGFFDARDGADARFSKSSSCNDCKTIKAPLSRASACRTDRDRRDRLVSGSTGFA